MKRHLSRPTLAHVGDLWLTAAEVGGALGALAWEKAGAILPGHRLLLRRIPQATGINVAQVARKSRPLLIGIEQHEADRSPGKPIRWPHVVSWERCRVLAAPECIGSHQTVIRFRSSLGSVRTCPALP